MAIERLEKQCQGKIPMTPLGIEPATLHTNKGLKVFEQTTVTVSLCPPPPVPHGPTWESRNYPTMDLERFSPYRAVNTPRLFFFTFM